MDNLTFAGYVEPEIIKEAMSGANLFLFLTKEETEGIPVIEALACKCNTIIRDIGAFDYLKDKKDIYKAKDLDDFEKESKIIFQGKLKDLTENGYKVAKTKDINDVGKKLKKIYESL